MYTKPLILKKIQSLVQKIYDRGKTRIVFKGFFFKEKAIAVLKA